MGRLRRIVSGTGSCQEYFPSSAALPNTILYLETSESMPLAWVLAYLLARLDEQG